jgi:hypothetical protein
MAAPAILSTEEALEELDAQIRGLWSQHVAYVCGRSLDVNALRVLPLIDHLLEQRHALTH